MLAWGEPLDLEYRPSTDDTFTLIDVSDAGHFDAMVDLNKVDEVIDHHLGNESYWHERIGEGTDIEFVGSACTMIYERWQREGKLDKMSQTAARLLICGILDNTLNFGADITTDRDKRAYHDLTPIANLPSDWPAQYFNACQKLITDDLAAGIRDDAKVLEFKQLPDKIGVGQLDIWDAKKLIADSLKTVRSIMPTIMTPWFMNVISIEESRNYLVCDDPALQAWLADLLRVTFKSGVAVTERMWLRKEIVKQSLEKADS
jgi:inorganic pyrophosphatase/exopolyphosphatase